MNWFEKLTGFTETTPYQVRQNIIIQGTTLTSSVNGKSYICGVLTTPSLHELREQVAAINKTSGNISIKEIVADVIPHFTVFLFRLYLCFFFEFVELR